MRIAGRGFALVDVAHVEHRLGGEQLGALERPFFLGILRPGQPRRLRCPQQIERLAEHRGFDLRFLVALLRLLDQIRHAPLEAVEIGEHQLGFDGVGIGGRVDPPFDMGDVAAFEAAQHVDDRIDFADVREELVAEPFALACAANEAGDVDELDLRFDLLRRLRDFLDLVEARVGHRDAADVRLDRAEGIVRRLRRGGFGECIEKGRFADVRQADDAAAEAHCCPDRLGELGAL